MIAALPGCALHPDLGTEPQPAAPESYAAAESFAGPQAEWPSDRWWAAYGDPQLTSLIDEALTDSPTLAAAAARVRQADAQLQHANASRSVTVYGEGGVQTSWQDLSAAGLPAAIRDSLPDDVQTKAAASLHVGRQLDFFGRNRASIAAATSQAEAARAEAAQARLELSTAVAQTYAELVRLNADRKAEEDALRVRTASRDLVHQRLNTGLEDEARLYQARAEVSAADLDIAGIDGQIARTRHALAALLGKGPDRGLAVTAPTGPVIGSRGLPAGLALDLIGRRPDIVAARRYAEVARAQITVARADFYVDGLASPEARARFQVDALPATLVIRNGQVSARFEHPAHRDVIRAAVLSPRRHNSQRAHDAAWTASRKLAAA